MNKMVKKINNQTLIFDYRKFIFWVEESILFLSDLHIGKVLHFLIKMAFLFPKMSLLKI